MKHLYSTLALTLVSFSVTAQDSSFTKATEWLTDHKFSIRKTFDGSKNESKPASLGFKEDHRSNNDFLNLDVAVKLSELELLEHTNSSLIFYPKVEWHKSNDANGKINKAEAGLNAEFLPFQLKAYDLAAGLPNPGLVISPWLLGTSAFKRNFVDKAYETKLTGQLSLASTYPFLPGAIIRNSNKAFIGRYYPYVGYEYNKIPDLIVKDKDEKFSTYFLRLFAEAWILPQTLQLTADGTYRKIINNSTALKDDLPIVIVAANYYPGAQEVIGIGYEYKNGYDPENKYILTRTSSIKLTIKL